VMAELALLALALGVVEGGLAFWLAAGWKL
jgi:hypothetical protein